MQWQAALVKKLTGQDGIFMDLISPNNIYKGNSILYTEFITRIGHCIELQSRGFERWPFFKAKCISKCFFLF